AAIFGRSWGTFIRGGRRRGSGAHQDEAARPAAIRPVLEPKQLVQRAGRDVVAPPGRTLRGHDEVMRPRPATPYIEVFPLHERIERPAQVEGEQVILDAEK